MNTIKIYYGKEDIKSRIPGLFPYMEFDDNGINSIHPASDSDCGCYAKIPCSIVLPTNVKLVVDNVTVLNENTEYSYTTLMNYYYEYRDKQPDSTFIVFMDKGIGKFTIDADIDYKECTLVPGYEYYANCSRLYNEYVRMSIMCQKYLEYKEETGNINCELECLLDKYRKLGGDTMRDYYGDKVSQAIEISDEYLSYAGNNLSLDFNINIVSKSDDLGILNTFLVFWNPDDTYNTGDIVIYNDRSYVCKYDEVKGEWDSNNFDLLSETYDITSDIIDGASDSRLTEFRGIRNYLDEGGAIRTPKVDEDWLWYYRIGAVGYYETTTDDRGNLMVNGHRTQDIGEYETKLMAYGDVLTNITRNKDEQTITFEYIIGCNLKARYKGSQTDDDGNVSYYYGDYEYNEDDPHGVLYTETYYYDYGSDIYNMTDEQFNTFVSFDRAIGDTYKKAKFDISLNRGTCMVVVDGVPKEYTYLASNFKAHMDATKDSLVNPVTKLDYLTGTTYKPTVKTDVFVGRGNAAAWERHIKLSELKTFEDLATYANGGFFNLR